MTEPTPARPSELPSELPSGLPSVSDAAAPGAVAWRRVGLYYAIALGGATVVATGLRLLGDALGPAGSGLVVAGTALLYMPLPLVAGLVVERSSGRRYLLGREWRALRAGFWRTWGRNALAAVVAVLAIAALGFAVAWLAGVAGLPGGGHLIVSDAELQEHLARLSPGMAPAAIPALPVLVAVGLVEGILAGVSVNGLFAFGEEYGWRGVLADELAPLGRLAPLLIGVLWGFWHAPIIIALGHNYGAQWGWGVPVMIAWTIPFSYLLAGVRRRTGSVLAPALLHGAFNGTAGLFTVLVAGGDALVALPVGILMALVLAGAALVEARLPRTQRSLPA
ncbi:MAG TPA: CPBP family intramembrane metalloprotease [Propionicimonas sp.]|jgi:membrane protease YdiL (CAAX protease family)|nr:CPBP family intramembrane metalloprotease [Propionicimonas sp.]